MSIRGSFGVRALSRVVAMGGSFGSEAGRMGDSSAPPRHRAGTDGWRAESNWAESLRLA